LVSPPCLLLPCIFLRLRRGCGGGLLKGTPGDGGADASAHSPLPLRGLVAHWFTFSVVRGDVEMGCSRWWAWNWNWATVRLARTRSCVRTRYGLRAPDVWSLVPPQISMPVTEPFYSEHNQNFRLLPVMWASPIVLTFNI
jgi:hypothetical protein